MKPRKSNKPGFVTISEFARRMKVSRPRISYLVKMGVISIGEDGLIEEMPAREILLDRRKLDDNPNGPQFSKTLSDARIRVESIRAEMLELEFKKQRGELIEREKVLHMVTGIITIAKTKLMAIPTKVAPLIVGSDSIRKIKAAIEKEIRAALEELARAKEIK